MKKFATAAIVSIGIAGSAMGGEILSAPPAEAEVVLSGSDHMGGSAAWWLPLLAIGALLLLMNDQCESNNFSQSCGSNGS